MKNNNIKNILSDLYVLAPELRSEESRLVNLIERLAVSRPNLEINEIFMNELKEELMSQSGDVQKSPAFSWGLKLSYAVSGAALTMLLLVPVVYWSYNNAGVKMSGNSFLPGQMANKISLNQAAFNVKKVGGQAFGKLTQNIQNANPEAMNTGAGAVNSKMLSQSSSMLGNRVNSVVSDKMMAPVATGGGVAGKMMAPAVDGNFIMPVMTSYKFVYKGEGIKTDMTTVSVLKKIKNVSLDSTSAILGQAGLGMINLGAFSDIKFQNLGMSEDKEFGLTVNVNAEDGSISVGQNWTKWQNTAISKCTDEKCFNDLRLKISDMPADQEIVALADGFLNDKNVNRENLGQGKVDSRWRDDYNRVEDKQLAYVPDSLSVVYPLRINDKDVYDEWGNKVGVSVSIDIRQKKVSGMWGLSPQNYEASDYDAQTNKDEIVRLLTRGGMYQNYFYGDNQNVKTVEVEVGDPVLVNVRINRYENNQNQELIVPALSFPVKEAPKEGYFSQKNIIVPLAKDFYTEDNVGGGMIPMMKGVTTEMGSAPAVPAVAPQATVDSVKR